MICQFTNNILPFYFFQEASRIRTEAENTKKRAVDLKDDADRLAEDVTDTEDQIKNLNDQADSDSDLATEVIAVNVAEYLMIILG